MADNLTFKVQIDAATTGIEQLKALTGQIDSLGGSTKVLSESTNNLESELKQLSSQQIAINAFKSIESQVNAANAAYIDADSKLTKLNSEIDNSENVTKKQIAAFEKAAANTKTLYQASEILSAKLTEAGAHLTRIGLSSANIAASQAQITIGFQTNAGAIQRLGVAATDTAAALGKLADSKAAQSARLAAEGERIQAEIAAERAEMLRLAQAEEQARAAARNLFPEDQQVALRQQAGLLSDASIKTEEIAKAQTLAKVSAENLVTAFAAIGGALGSFYLAKKAITSVIDASVKLENIRTTLTTVSGGTEEAARNFAFVEQTATKLGIGLVESAHNFAQLAAAARNTALEGEETRRIFDAVATAVVKSGGSTEQAQKAFLAITQIISKGVVSGEELRQQLAEALPGAEKIFADALGYTTTQLNAALASGSLLATETLPKFAEQLERLNGPGGLDTTGAAIGRLGIEWTKFKDAISDNESVKQISIGFASVFQSLTDKLTVARRESINTEDGFQDLHDALVRLSAQEEVGSSKWVEYRKQLAFTRDILEVFNEEAKKVELPKPDTSGKGLFEDEINSTIKRFDLLVEKGKTTKEALGEIGKDFHPFKLDEIIKFGTALERLSESGKISSKELQDELGGITKKLDSEELQVFSQNIQNTFNTGQISAQAFANFNDSVVRESLKRLGLDADQALNGFSKSTTDALANLDSLAKGLEGAGFAAKESSQIISDALEKAIPKAQTIDDVNAFGSAIKQLGDEGALSTGQLAEATAELTQRRRELEEQEVKNNAVLQEAVRTQSEAVKVAERETTAVERQTQGKVDEARLRYDAAKASGNEAAAASALIGLKAAEAAQSEQVAKAKVDEAETAKAYLADIIAEVEADGTLTEAEQALIDKAQEVADAKAAEAEAAKTTAAEKLIDAAATDKQTAAAKKGVDAAKDGAKAQKDLATSQEAVVSTTLVSTKAAEAYNAVLSRLNGTWEGYAAAQKIAADAAQQFSRSQDLAEKLSAAASSGQGLGEALKAAGGNVEALRKKFNLLDETQLSGLESSLQAIQSKIDSLRESSLSALEQQIRDANALSGNQEGNQLLDDANKKRALAQQLAEAQAAGDGQSVKNLKEAQALLETNIAERERQKKASEITLDKETRSAFQRGDREALIALQDAQKTAGRIFAGSDQQFASALKSASVSFATAVHNASEAAGKSLAEETKSFQASIDAIRASTANFGKGIDDQIRELRRGTLSEGEQQADKFKEINEKLQKAQEATAKGQLDDARALRDEIVSLGQSLAKSGDKASTDKAIQVLEQAKALNERIGSADEQAATQLHNLKVANIKLEEQTAIDAAKKTFDEQVAAAKKLHEIVMAQIAAEAAARKVTGVSEIDTLKGTIFTSSGGGGGSGGSGGGGGRRGSDLPLGDTPNPSNTFASGTILPGYGGGDRVPALLEDGEAVIPKHRVAQYRPLIEHLLTDLPIARFAQGGYIGEQADTASGRYRGPADLTIDIKDSTGKKARGAFPADATTKQVIQQLQRDLAKR